MKKITKILATLCFASGLTYSIAHGSAAQKFEKNAADKSIDTAKTPNVPALGHRRRSSLVVNAPKVVDANDVFRAIETGNGDAVIDIMLEQVIHPDSKKNGVGFSLLEAAIAFDHPGIVKTLFRFGASPVIEGEIVKNKNSAAITKMLQEYRKFRIQLNIKNKHLKPEAL